MVITSPLTNIKGYIANRPPLVLFTLCLIAFAITTFTFAYYVEHRSDLPNIDAHKDWLSFLSYLSNHDLCIVNNQTQNVVHDNDTVDLITVTVMATLSSSVNFYNMSIKNVQGYVTATDWVSDCPSSPINRVHVSYNVPKTFNRNGSNTLIENVCVTITGPKELLAPATDEKKCMRPSDLLPHDKWTIVNKQKLEVCSEGVRANLKYQLSPHNTLLLTMDDRRIINLHLFHTSYFLLVMAITLICYAMIKGKPTTVKHQPLDKMPIDA